MSDSMTTTSHTDIRQWAERHDAVPAKVEETGGEMGEGILRLDFGRDNEGLEQCSWDEWFAIFDENKLALLYQPDNDNSTFNKIVSR
ncbi:hypothetical protein [Parvularcula sp. LCG005]|uniref:hypothetical protein n=1 Tax=Parvularcula sp. LCG005 TaxID=3078805 RepID=UPI0029435EA0|nr:hypothetical protein [Parvularcula sp. LCG005]WOI53727.1 hypothetical protein RUI03_01715 [Parvularcula sp. LCG005]